MFEHLLLHALVGHNKEGNFIYILVFLFFAALLPVGAAVGLGIYTWNEIAMENDYARRFGAEWKVHYEVEQGSLSTARTRAAVASAGAVAVAGLGVFLYCQFIPAFRGQGSAPRVRRRRRRRSR